MKVEPNFFFFFWQSLILAYWCFIWFFFTDNYLCSNCKTFFWTLSENIWINAWTVTNCIFLQSSCASPLVTGCCFQLLHGSCFAGGASCFSSALIRLHQLRETASHRGTGNWTKHQVSEGWGHHAFFSMKYVVLEVMFFGISERSIVLAF